MSSIFYKLGKHAGKAMKKGQWIYKSVFGTEEEALEAEHILGDELAHKLRQEVSSVDDQAIQSNIREISTQLTTLLTNKQRKFKFDVIDAGEINAFALPGGYIYFTGALLKYCDFNDAEIAFIMGHEIGHVVRGHPFDRVLAQSSIGFISKITRMGGGLGKLAHPILMKLLRSNYSQTQELDADLFGAQLMSAAGYDPKYGVSALKKLASQREKTPKIFNYFSTHPEIDERIREVALYRKKHWQS